MCSKKMAGAGMQYFQALALSFCLVYLYFKAKFNARMVDDESPLRRAALVALAGVFVAGGASGSMAPLFWTGIAYLLSRALLGVEAGFNAAFAFAAAISFLAA